MDCNQVEELISSYIEHELSTELQGEISLHLAQCEVCRKLKEKIEELMYVFPELEEEVPFFVKNRLYYIPESQDIIEARIDTKFFYLKWLAAAIGTVVLFLNLFYFTNIYPPAKRVLHGVMAQIKTFTVETGAFIEEVKASDGAALFSFLKKDPGITDQVDAEANQDEDSDTNLKKRKLDIEKKLKPKGGNNG